MRVDDKIKYDCIIIVTDAFRVGGREAFLMTYLCEIRQRYEIALVLITRTVSADAPSDIFDEIHVVEGEGADEIREWVGIAATVLARYDAALIWAHHFRMFPAWLIASLNQQPLLATFHGPVDSIARPERFIDAVGMALALHRQPFTTAVSEEVVKSLAAALTSPLDIRTLPNRVLIPNRSYDKPEPIFGRHVCMLMLTRSTKLGHIRAAVDFLGHWRRLKGGATLRIVTDGIEPVETTKRIGGVFDTAKRLGRKWVLSKVSRLKNLEGVVFAPATPDPYSEIAACDVVLGMGRTILEGIALAKPTVLVGYERVIDLVIGENFRELRRTNFSGRGVSAAPQEVVVRNTAATLAADAPLLNTVINEIDVAANWDNTAELFEAASECSPRDEDRDLAHRLIETLAGALPIGQIASSILANLSSPERRTVELLWISKSNSMIF